MKFNMKAAVAAAALVVSLAAAPQASALKLLGLAIDGSGSINAAEFALQKNAYVTALTNLVPTNGSVAIGIWQFGSTVQQEFASAVITGANKAAMIAAVSGMTQLGGLTNIAGAITAAQTSLLALSNNAADTHIIDVSTDGGGNIGNQVTAATAAVAAGIDQVNCLGVGPGAVCDFETGVGSFEILAADFNAFSTAIQTKIGKELPEAGSLMLVGLGLAGLGVAARRRKAA